MNEAEELADTHVDLITGFPNLQFQEVVSPLGKQTNLAGFLSQLAGRGLGSVGAPSVLTQSVTSNRASGPMGFSSGELSYGIPALGEASEDLFFYPLEHVTLKTGETGYYPLFTMAVPYQHIYVWTVSDHPQNPDPWGHPQPTSPDQPEFVWHSLRLTNPGSVPWTTGPDRSHEERPDSSDRTPSPTPHPKPKRPFISPKPSTCAADQSEVESQRERQAVHLYRGIFDRVTVTGTLHVSNFQSEPITIEIKKTLSGDVTASAPAAHVLTLASGRGNLNPTQQLTWTVSIGPGQTTELTYTYQLLAQH